MAQKRKNKEKTKNKNPSSSEEMVRAIIHEGSLEGRSETVGLVFVKQVGFKLGVKERGNYS